jgi:predicted phosphodiesterase
MILPSVLAENSTLKFGVFGHVYPGYEDLESSIGTVNSLDLDFVVFLGDSLTQPDESWNKLNEIVSNITVPIYFVPGNHDIFENGSFNQGYFLSEMSNELYYTFEVKNKTFIVLNTVLGKTNEYGISEEQISFLNEVYGSTNNDKFIFMHHCLFFNYDNLFCNSRPYYESNTWTEIAPIIQDETKAVFLGDVGVHEPYFSYKENNLSYFGVGFSSQEDRIKTPRFFLYVEVEDDKFSVEPILTVKDISQESFSGQVENTLKQNLKAYVKKNLTFVFKLIFFSFSLILVIALGLTYKLLRLKTI